MPPPHGDVHMSCVVPKCSWNAATSKSANAPDHVMPSMSAGVEPGVGDGPLRGLGADLTRGAPRRLRVRRLTDARDRDLRRATSSSSVA